MICFKERLFKSNPNDGYSRVCGIPRSYRDIEEQMFESVDHSNVNKCLIRYSPGLESEFKKNH